MLGCFMRRKSPGSPLSSLPSYNQYKGDPASACLLCRSCPKNGEFDYCGAVCQLNARNQSPLLLEVPQGHTTFATGKPSRAAFRTDIVNSRSNNHGEWARARESNMYTKLWKVQPRLNHTTTICSFFIALVTCFELIPCGRKTYGNESFCYHGTERSCRLGDDGQTTLCPSSFCKVCSIIRTSFEVNLANPSGA
jgi:hypothetical protein